MDAGRLNKRITFLDSVDTQDSSGQSIPAWTTQICSVWASIEPLSGRQLALAQANTVTSTATHRITIRFNPALVNQVNYRISYAGGYTGNNTTPAVRVFRINSIVDFQEAHTEMHLMVTEVP